MSNKGPSVLIVDDDRDACANLRDILADLGYHVDVAYDGASALDLIRQQPYDVALLDLKMPGMDGLTLYRRIKSIRAGTVAIIVTAYATSETASAAVEAGAWTVLPKPVQFSEVLRLVAQALDQPLVLVVDDDADLCMNLWDILRQNGYRVCLAHDAGQAAERLGDRDYSVVLIDMKLDDGNGRDVFVKVRHGNPSTRTVLITGRRGEMDQLIQRVVEEGADAVCYKPFDVPQLIETIRQLTRPTDRNR
jgi:DNA-binding NtrC family response regulator